jgi:hypothetical protein
VIEDVVVKLVHAYALPCVTRRVLAPTFWWLVLQYTCMLYYAVGGFESAGRLIRVNELWVGDEVAQASNVTVV